MALSYAQAADAARSHLDKWSDGGIPLRIMEEHAQEFDVGWIFYYQSTRFLETGNHSEMLVGNAPLFVARTDGTVKVISYHRSAEESMAAYRACGDANAAKIAEVELCNWKRGAAKVEAIRTIRKHSGLGLADAKQIVDDCLDGKTRIINTCNVKVADELVAELTAINFVAHVSYGTR